MRDGSSRAVETVAMAASVQVFYRLDHDQGVAAARGVRDRDPRALRLQPVPLSPTPHIIEATRRPDQ